jgi:hypothetical protein
VADDLGPFRRAPQSEVKRQALVELSQSVTDLFATAERLRQENLERRREAQVQAQELRGAVRTAREDVKTLQRFRGAACIVNRRTD